jgi:hypothetical protein
MPAVPRPTSNEPHENASRDGEITSVDEFLTRIDEAAREGDTTSIGEVVDRMGARSFVPLLLFAGLVMVAPGVGDIPGVPTLMGLIVLLVCSQLLLKRRHIWLPGWLLKRNVANSNVRTGVRWMRRPARFLDRWSKRRQTRFVRHAGFYTIVSACALIATASPAFEVVLFSANFAGAAITAFALALLAEDGVLAMIAIAFCAAMVGTFIYPFI